MNRIIKEIKEALNTDTKTKAYDTQAKVIRSEGKTLWVHIPGGVDETPVKKTINAKAGDTVQVRVSGGSAWLVGNQSAPPTDDTRAIVAETTAITANENATIAAQAAESAVESANVASAAAASAQTSATNALTAAQSAQTSADSALVSLSTVEDVVGVLNWITAHGTMTLTSDVTVNPAHVYFVVDPAGDYVVGGTHYSIVAEPKVEDISTYYELSVDESVQNYVATHVVVDTEGLWLIPDSGGNKVLIATGAGSSYTTAGTYIIGKVSGVDTVFAKFTTDGATMNATNNTQIAHLGYGSGKNSGGGTSVAPYYSLGVRKSTSTIGNYSTAEGYNTTASGYVSHAEGHSTTASGSYAHAEGGPVGGGGVQLPAPIASGTSSHAEGCYTVASESYSHAQNLGTIANGIAQTVIGSYNVADNYHTFIIGNGSNDTYRSNALTVDSFGNVNIPAGANYMIDDVPIGGGGGGDVTGVKGDAEVTYRTGNVNLTAANIGALPSNTEIHNVPSGGTTGQILAKASGTNYDLEWKTLVGGVSDVQEDGTSIVVSGVANIHTMTGATSSANGTKGLAPKPTTGQHDYTLFGDGTWDELKYNRYLQSSDITYSIDRYNANQQVGSIVVPAATTSAIGLMTSSDKTKLDGIASGAEVNILDGVQLNGSDLTITNKKVNVPVMIGATSSANGAVGLVPKPLVGEQATLLFGNGTWDKFYVSTSSSGASQFTADIEKYTSSDVLASITIPGATTTKAGVMTTADKNIVDSIPIGGTTGQVLAKASATDYDFEWINQGGSGSTEYDFTTTITPSIDSRGVSFYNYAVYPTDTSVLTNDNILKMRAYLQNGTTLYPLLIVQTFPSSTYAIASVKSFYGNPQNTSSTKVTGTLHFIAPFEISNVITSK